VVWQAAASASAVVVSAANGDPKHRFTPVLTRQGDPHAYCVECSTQLEPWEGQAGGCTLVLDSPPSCDLQRHARDRLRISAPGPFRETGTDPAKSFARHWCLGGIYNGGIYVVPYPPPCNSTYLCRSEPYKAPSPCFEIAPGRRACAVVAQPKLYRYPDGLLTPLAKGTRIIGYFQSRSENEENGRAWDGEQG
jgi:hypothetical protein